jgi:tetratricopeptide (TPR) repeat protein
VRPQDAAGWGRLAATARVADPDPRRAELRTLWGQPNRRAQLAPLRALAAGADAGTWPAQSLDLLAAALAAAGDVDAAAALLRRAVVRHADDVWINYDLAQLLWRAGPARLDEAIRYYTAARALRPETAHALAHALEARGESDEAIAVFRDLQRLRPGDGRHIVCLGQALQSRGRPDEARAALDAAVTALREAIRLKPDDAHAHHSLGSALAAQGKHEAAAAAYREVIRLRPDSAQAHYSLGSALAAQGKHEAAAAAYREAIRLNPDYAEAHCNLAQLLLSLGKYAEALDEYRTGHALGSKRPDWRYPSAQWVRRAERLATLADRLPALLRGDYHPKDNAERLDLARVCYGTKRHAAAARFWAEAIDADPKLADDLRAQHRYDAACAAALAGCGQGRDDPPPDDAARARLRGQALDWLRADLALRAKQLDTDAAAARTALAHWKDDPDLSGVRDPAALAALPESERDAWRALWAEVDRLLLRSGDSP